MERILVSLLYILDSRLEKMHIEKETERDKDSGERGKENDNKKEKESKNIII